MTRGKKKAWRGGREGGEKKGGEEGRREGEREGRGEREKKRETVNIENAPMVYNIVYMILLYTA